MIIWPDDVDYRFAFRSNGSLSSWRKHNGEGEML